ncbi:endonuclease domain-containing protein [Bradyrhizobium barranii]|uniref:endonuclease domain-containing protein n=1 Tax=Bradyrhizobium barranii TaxID=2992140 RepID=UPI003CCB3A91
MVEAGATPKPASCEACGRDGKICADHEHSSGAFRGWLCADCNLTLGKMSDNAAWLRSLADYLERPNEAPKPTP